jgi:hypothetical protein
MALPEWLYFSFTPCDWEFGVGFSLPTASRNYFPGSKLIFEGIGVYLFAGPLTFGVCKPPIEIIEEGR